MSHHSASLRETQESYEQRFNCVICLCPHFRMVTGMCQHRVCADCLYDKAGIIRETFKKCPVCQVFWPFPTIRPEIPEDSIMMMQCLGLRKCPNHDKGCQMELWEWDIEEHLRSCKLLKSKKRQQCKDTKEVKRISRRSQRYSK